MANLLSSLRDTSSHENYKAIGSTGIIHRKFTAQHGLNTLPLGILGRFTAGFLIPHKMAVFLEKGVYVQHGLVVILWCLGCLIKYTWTVDTPTTNPFTEGEWTFSKKSKYALL